jgi:hypothetical protein
VTATNDAEQILATTADGARGEHRHHDEDGNDQGCLGTAMHAVQAIAPVCTAAPGIRTFLDLPTIVGRHVF